MLVCHLHWPIETWRQSTVLRLPSQLGRAQTGLLREDLEGLGIMDSHQDTKEPASSRGRPESSAGCDGRGGLPLHQGVAADAGRTCGVVRGGTCLIR